VNVLLLLDGIEHHQDLLPILVHVIIEDLHLIVEDEVFLVLLAQFDQLVLPVICLKVLLEVADEEVEIE
jgi:hypothetical protein